VVVIEVIYDHLITRHVRLDVPQGSSTTIRPKVRTGTIDGSTIVQLLVNGRLVWEGPLRELQENTYEVPVYHRQADRYEQPRRPPPLLPLFAATGQVDWYAEHGSVIVYLPKTGFQTR
jgi:hypothetical protein